MSGPLSLLQNLVHARRSQVLAGHLADLIPQGATVLDVGCGDGLVASLIQQRRPDLKIEGIDSLVRPNTRIPVRFFDGITIPHSDQSVDVVLLVDVLHHLHQPLALLQEASRVARLGVVLKDHTLDGFLAGPTLMGMDWSGNARHGVALPFHYLPENTWRRAFSRLGLQASKWRGQLGLYPWPLSVLFDRKLHFTAFVEREKTASVAPPPAVEDLDQVAWELAYLQFETPDQERLKFQKRLQWAGAPSWPRDSRILELFCGRGNGLTALEKMGFHNLAGVDLSPALAAQYRGSARVHVGDCRELPFADGSQDIVIVQGGLHHLFNLETDYPKVVDEIRRVLANGGRVVVVEPWLTPFLRLVHWTLKSHFLCLLHTKLDALRELIRFEQRTYFQWLGRPHPILKVLEQRFQPQRRKISWGKLCFVGLKADESLRLVA